MRPGVTDPLWVRILLTALALLFLFGFLVVPLAAVFPIRIISRHQPMRQTMRALSKS